MGTILTQAQVQVDAWVKKLIDEEDEELMPPHFEFFYMGDGLCLSYKKPNQFNWKIYIRFPGSEYKETLIMNPQGDWDAATLPLLSQAQTWAKEVISKAVIQIKVSEGVWKDLVK